MKLRSGPDGIQLFEREIGLNILLDAIERPTTTWSRAPRFVSIALTNNCDLRCEYCYAPKSKAGLALQSICEWGKELDLNGCLGIGFGGGEPTLSPILVEACEFLTRQTGMSVTMTTHGHRMNDELIEKLKGSLNFVRVSMDGIDSVYERLRGRRFDVFLDRLSKIGKAFRFGINFLVNEDTFPCLDDSVRIAADLGCVEFLLLPEQAVRGRGGVQRQTMDRLREWTLNPPAGVNFAISEGYDGFQTCNPFRREIALRAYAHIDASGILKRTSYDQAGVAIENAGILFALENLAR